MKIATFTVSPELLRGCLHLPDSTEVYSAAWDLNRNCLRLYVRDECLDDLPEGAVVPEINPVCTKSAEGVITTTLK